MRVIVTTVDGHVHEFDHVDNHNIQPPGIFVITRGEETPLAFWPITQLRSVEFPEAGNQVQLVKGSL